MKILFYEMKGGRAYVKLLDETKLRFIFLKACILIIPRTPEVSGGDVLQSYIILYDKKLKYGTPARFRK